MHFEQAPFETARWVGTDDKALLKRFIDETRSAVAEDHDGAIVFLARNSWELNRTLKDWPDLKFAATREQG
jgi:peptide chain release factor 3